MENNHEVDQVEVPATQSKPRGFAAISPERQKEIASLGGKAAHAKGKAHQWTAEEARAAGKKGGIRFQEKRRELVKNNQTTDSAAE